MQTDNLKAFIRLHGEEDPMQLLLDVARYPDIDVPYAVAQITARRQIKDKLPSWYANPDLLFPSKLATEQCSSEQTALYKQRLVNGRMHLVDLTGGLGVDSFFFSRKVAKVTYVERFASYCEAARHNFAALGVPNIEVEEGNVEDLLDSLPEVDCFYLDPARRGEGNKRVFAISDCEPDLTSLLPSLLQITPLVIVKLSPMLDLRHTLLQFPGTAEIHVVAVKNECKELLFVIRREPNQEEPVIVCVNMEKEKEEQFFRFTFKEEQDHPAELAYKTEGYLYEPNAAILKAGAFQSCAARFGLRKLHVSSHLYTSDCLVPFPGRIFRIEEVIPFHTKVCKNIAVRIPKANLTTRNFPLSVSDLRKRLKIAEGGDSYLFATTLAAGEKVLLLCTKALPSAEK